MWLAIDRKLIEKGMMYTMTFVSRQQGRKWIEAGTIPGRNEVYQQELAMAYMFYMVMSRERDPQGRTGWERWEAEGWAGLSNDERVLTQYRRHSFATVLEVQRVLDGQRIQCVDLLAPEPKPFLLFDRSMASQLVRFDRLLTFVTHYPHFSRPSFYPTSIPVDMWSDWLDNVRRFWREERRTHPDLTLQDWLAENFGEAAAAIQELAQSRRRAMLDQLDLHQCVATYKLNAPRAQIEALLRGKQDFTEQPEPEAEAPFAKPLALFRWLRRGESKALEDRLVPAFRHDNPEAEGYGILGNVRVYESTLQVDALHKKHFEFAQEMIAKYFGPLLSLERQTVVDVAKIMRDNLDREEAMNQARGAQSQSSEEDQDDLPALHGASIGSLTPADPEAFELAPSLDSFAEEESEEVPDLAAAVGATLARLPAERPARPKLSPEQMREGLERVHTEHYRKFLRNPVPMLQGQTPLEAAQDPAMRPTLIELMKLHLNGIARRNQAEHLSLSLDSVIEELGLTELK